MIKLIQKFRYIFYIFYFNTHTIFFYCDAFFNENIIKFLTKITFIYELSLVKKSIGLINSFDKKRFDLFFKKYVFLFLIQFIILFLIFLNSYSLFDKDNSILFQ